MPEFSGNLIIHSLCGPNGTGSAAEFKILINESGLALAKDSGCCCCDVSCLTACGSFYSPCNYAPCTVVTSGVASYTPPYDTGSGPPTPCSDGGYYLERWNACAGPLTPPSFIVNITGIVWQSGYPQAYRPYRIDDQYNPGLEDLTTDPSDLGYCLIWNVDHGVNYGINTCDSTYSNTYCCQRYNVKITLYKIECSTEQIVNVTDEAITSFNDVSGWIQSSKGYYERCVVSTPTGTTTNCGCCGADNLILNDIYGPPTLVCAP